MLRRIAAAAGAALVLLCSSSCTLSETPELVNLHTCYVPPKMTFLGDSIAAGYGLEGYTSTDNYNCPSYSNILKERYEAELMNECGHIMVNKAVSGYTSDDLIKQLQSGMLDNDLRDSDAVVVSIGGNDLLGLMLDLLGSFGINTSGSFNLDNFNLFDAAFSLINLEGDMDAALDRFNENIKIISEELTNRTDGKVFIQTLYDPLEYYKTARIVPGLDGDSAGAIAELLGEKFEDLDADKKFREILTNFSDEKIGRLNSIIKENAADNYIVVDVAADFMGKTATLTNIGNFDIHPNEEGHVVIASDIDAAFRATGFSYTTFEYGDKQLTKEGKAVILTVIAIICFLYAGVLVIVIVKKLRG